MQNVSIIPQLKKKKPEHTTGTIIIRGYYNRKPVAAISTGYKIEQSHWDLETKKVKGSAPNAALINQCIQMKLQEMNATLMKYEIMGGQVNRSRIKAAVKGLNPARDFHQFCLDAIAEHYTNPETIRTYKSEVTKLQQFRPELSFADLDYSTLQAYRMYMKEELGNEPNTIFKTFKFMNRMLNIAMKQGGIIDENPMNDFDRGKYTNPQRQFIELEACDAIFKLIARDDVPVIVRRVSIYYLLMCYSGLRFEDAMAFDPDIHTIDNQRLVKKTSKGEGMVLNLLLWDRLAPIIDLIREHRLNLTNKKFNKWMEVVTTLAGIDKKLTAHIGRHTFGGFLADAEIPIEQAQHLLGHKDIRSTRIYYHMKQKKLDEAASKLNNL